MLSTGLSRYPHSPWFLGQVGKAIGHRNEKLCPRKACLALKRPRLSVSVEKINRHKTLLHNSVPMSPQPPSKAMESQVTDLPKAQQERSWDLAGCPTALGRMVYREEGRGRGEGRKGAGLFPGPWTLEALSLSTFCFPISSPGV